MTLLGLEYRLDFESTLELVLSMLFILLGELNSDWFAEVDRSVYLFLEL